MPDQHDSTIAAANSLGRTALIAALLVGISSLFLPLVAGYGTVLFQHVTLYGWRLAEAITSNEFAYAHRGFSWSIAGVLNVLSFAIPAGAVWVVFHRQRPRVGQLLILGWCAFYLASLFVLFRAYDGP